MSEADIEKRAHNERKKKKGVLSNQMNKRKKERNKIFKVLESGDSVNGKSTAWSLHLKYFSKLSTLMSRFRTIP